MGRTSDAKDRLMAAAIDLIWGESYGAVTIDDICKKADVRKGSFYYFFPGKAELAVAAIEHKWQTQMKPFLDKYLSPDKEPYFRFKEYFEAVVAMHDDIVAKHGKMLGCPMCSVGNETSTNQEAVCGAIRDVFAKKRRYYESAIRDAVAAGSMPPCDPSDTATALFALLDGMITQARIMNDVKLLKNLPDLGVAMLKLKAPAVA